MAPRRRRPTEPSGHIARSVGSFQESALPSSGASDSTIHRPSRPAPGRWPPWATWPATCAGPGTRRRRTSSRPWTPSCGSRPAATRCGSSAPSAGPGSSELAGDDELPRAARRGARRPRAYLTGDRWYQRRKAGADGPRAIAYFSPEFGITAVLPQYSGGLGILAGDHLKAASDLGVPLVGVGLLYRHGYFKQALSREGWQQETYPVLDPDGLPISLLREADGTARHDLDRDARRARPGRPDLGRQRRPGAAAAARHRRRGQPRPLPRRHRPPLRRQQRAPAAPGAAARRRRRPRAARLLPDHRRTRRPRCSTPTRATPASSASSGSASSPSAEGGPGARLRHRARGRPRRPPSSPPTRPVPGRHRPVPARRWSSSTSATPAPTPGVPVERILALGAEDYDGGDAGGLQHGGDGLPARPARQRRLAAARPRQPRHVQRPVAGLRRGRGADRLDHQRRARPDLGGPRGLRARRRATAPTPTPTTPTPSGTRSTRSRPPRSGRSSGSCASGSSHDARQPAAQVVRQARRRHGRARLDRHRARPRRADDRLRAPRAVVQAADADAARPRAAQAPAARTPSARCS